MRTNTDKADKEPPEPSPRTMKLLMSWEQKYGLDVIRRHLDDGLFSRDPDEQRRCYEWLERRKAARRNIAIVEVALAFTLMLLAGVGVIFAL